MIRRVAVAFAIAGCAMSESAYQERSMEVYQRNEKRLAEATADLQRRGYVLLDQDPEIRHASLDEPDRQRCVEEDHRRFRPELKALSPDEQLHIQIGQATPAGTQPKPPVLVTARADQACTFFQKRANELDVTKDDGTSARIVFSELRTVARAQNGELVLVRIQQKVISKRSLYVKRTCHHEPHVESDPLERRMPLTVLWAPLPKMQTIEMPVEREELTADCTDHVY